MSGYLSLILGAAIGGLLADGATEADLRDMVDQAIKAAVLSAADPERFQALGDMAITTAMELRDDEG